MIVFVYGTLKSKYHNSAILKDGKSQFLGDAIVDGYCLLDGGFPVAMPDPKSSVKGEIWDIGDNEITLMRLDRLESNGSMYNRTPAVAQSVVDNADVDCELYVGGDMWNKYRRELCPVIDGHYEWNITY